MKIRTIVILLRTPTQMPSYIRSRRKARQINGDLYLLSAEYRSEDVKDIQLVKQWLGVEYVFKSNRDNTLMFCEKIQEVEYEIIK